MNTNKLFEMYNSTFKPALTEGEYKVTMVKHEYVANEKAPYIKITFKVKDSDRELTENRFEKGFGVMVSHLRQQLGREKEEIQPIAFFNKLIEDQTEFSIWVVKRVVNGYPRTNFNFLKPIKDEKPNTTVVEDATDSVDSVDTTPNAEVVED